MTMAGLKTGKEFVEHYPTMFTEDKDWWAEQIDNLIARSRPVPSGVSDEKLIEMAMIWHKSSPDGIEFNDMVDLAKAVRDLCISRNTGGRERDAVEFAVRMMIEVDMGDEEIKELADQLYADYLKGR